MEIIKQTNPPSTKEDRRKCTLSNEMIKMLVKQMAHELENHNLYKTFAAYFYRNDLSKLGVYYDLRAKEEYEHHSWIYTYLTDCDAEFQYPLVKVTEVEIKNHVTPFELTVDKEIETTLGIYEIVNKSFNEHDWNTYVFLTGDDPKTGKLVKEQRNKISLAA